jgi:hypothetical protein
MVSGSSPDDGIQLVLRSLTFRLADHRTIAVVERRQLEVAKRRERQIILGAATEVTSSLRTTSYIKTSRRAVRGSCRQLRNRV